MNVDFISSFKDIIKYPHNYFSELCMEANNSFTLFNYGPYIANHMPDCYLDYPDSIIIKNDLFRLMYEVALMIKAGNENTVIKDAKEMYLRIIDRNNKRPYSYSNQSISIARQMISSIREDQYTSHLLESALLNYAPIVQYAGTIVKPEMETHVSIESVDLNKLATDIEHYLVQYILPIMLKDTGFVNIDDMIQNKETELSIPYDYLRVANSDDIVSIYFDMVFLKYIGFNKDFAIAKDDLIKLNKLYNKIIKGENVNVLEALESFSKLTATF